MNPFNLKLKNFNLIDQGPDFFFLVKDSFNKSNQFDLDCKFLNQTDQFFSQD